MKRAILISLLLATVGLTNLVQAQTWNQFSLATNNYWPYIACSADGATVFAVQNDFFKDVRGIYKSTNSGGSWQKTSASTNLYYLGLAVSADGSRVYFPSSSGIYASTKGGETLGVTGATNGSWWNLALAGDGIKICGLRNTGTDFEMYYSTNAGTDWFAQSNSEPSQFLGGCAISADGRKLVAQVVLNGFSATARSTNGGETWHRLTNAPYFQQSGTSSQNLACSADGTKIVAAYISSGSYPNFFPKPCAIFLSTNAGEAWIKTTAPSNFWSAVSMSADGSRILAVAGGGYSGTNGYIVTSIDSGATWTTINFTNQDIHSTACSADGGKMYASSGFNYFQNTGQIHCGYAPSPSSLSLDQSNEVATVKWLVPSTNLVLQQSSDLQNWSATANAPALNTINLQNEVALPATGNQFFRLATP